MSTMFMGEYNHSIDAKGRIMIPSKFRDSLGEGFVITKGVDKGCLWVFPADEWEAFYEKLRSSLTFTNKDSRQFMRHFMAGAMNAQFDKQGRILLAQNLREYANLTTNVTLVGTGPRIEIWDTQTWNDEEAEIDADLIAERIGELGFGI